MASLERVLAWLDASVIDGASPLPIDFDFTDGAGHRRPAYRGLAMRTILRHPAADDALARRFIDRVTPSLLEFAKADDALRGADSNAILAAAFDAGAIEASTAATSEERALAQRCFARLLRNQQPDGTFLTRADADNPEPLWYAELALLHATHVHAIERDDADARAAAGRAARYLAAEVQPDHASAQPWAIAALLEEPDGIPLADTMLHVAGVQEPTTMDAASLLLLADALRCGRRRDSR